MGTAAFDDRARDGFVRVYEASFFEVARYVCRRAPADSCEGAVIETFLTAWRQWLSLPSEPLPWLYSIARTAIPKAAQRANPQAPAPPPHAIELRGDNAAPGETDRLSFALVALAADDQELLLLVAWECLDVRRAASAVGCSSMTLGWRLRRVRKRCEKALGAYDRDHPLPGAPTPARLVKAGTLTMNKHVRWARELLGNFDPVPGHTRIDALLGPLRARILATPVD